MAIENILSNDNYISKDFQSAYTEALDAIGKLNNKWLIDGEGNESDPGVVLVKLIASAIDKISYNSDKDSLENYPDTLQTDTAARLVFSPVYKPHWYRSAHGYVTIKNNGDTPITLPPYLMLQSENGDVIYTTIQNGTTIEPNSVVSDIEVREGKIKTLTINGSDCITFDSFIDNKLYLDDYNVAENGVFVEPYSATSNVDYNRDLTQKASYSDWVQVDNIYVHDWSSNDVNNGYYYEFNISPQNNKPYLQFVDDLAEKINDGLRIRYILSNGEEGNVSSGKLTNVYIGDSELTLDSDNLKIANIYPIGNGKQPESIESARKNYFKDIDVCNTLVTLRDYANAIYLADGLVSNCFVCDRTNDVQTFKKIQTATNLISDTEDAGLSVFNLKFYGLTNRDINYGVEDGQDIALKNSIYSSNYAKTFEIISPEYPAGVPTSIPQNVKDYISETKSVNHEFASIRND